MREYLKLSQIASISITSKTYSELKCFFALPFSSSALGLKLILTLCSKVFVAVFTYKHFRNWLPIIINSLLK